MCVALISQRKVCGPIYTKFYNPSNTLMTENEEILIYLGTIIASDILRSYNVVWFDWPQSAKGNFSPVSIS